MLFLHKKYKYVVKSPKRGDITETILGIFRKLILISILSLNSYNYLQFNHKILNFVYKYRFQGASLTRRCFHDECHKSLIKYFTKNGR